jgi:predicted phage terminase large subunit-like protein
MSKIPFRVFLDTLNIISQQKTPDVHIEIADWLESTESNQRRILQCFRHGGKSFIIGAYVCWKLLTDPNWTCLLISAKRNLALRNSMFIRNTIENHPMLQHLKSDLYTWKSETFTVERPIMQLNPSVTVSSLGASFTGLHANCVIADDVETSDNVLSSDMRAKTRERVTEFGKLANNILMVGTPHHEDSIYDHLHTVGYDLKKIPAVRTRPIKQEDGTLMEEDYLAWPDHPEGMFTYSWLERQRNETTEGDYMSQYMLVPQNIFQPLVQLENIKYYNDELLWQNIAQPFGTYITSCTIGKKQITRLCAAWDAATGLQGRDASVLAVAARDPDGNTYIHDMVTLSAVDKNTKDFTGQCREIINTCKAHKISHVYVEENFSSTLANELRRVAREMKIMVQVVPKFRNKNKMVFIAQIMEPLIKVGRLYVHERVRDQSNFMDELQAFPRMKHDDCIDAAAEAISNLPNLSVDVSKVAKIFNPLQNTGSRFRIN